MAETPVDEQLWDEFHQLVNMSSRELSEWLRTEAADPDEEELPDQAGGPIGQRVLGILRKRRTDLDGEDVRTMREVVDRIRAERGQEELEPAAGKPGWRHRMMSLGHDPLKA